MNKGTKKILIIGSVAAAGVAFWYFFFGPGASSAPAPASSASSGSGSSTTTMPTGAGVQAGSGAQLNTSGSCPGISSAVYAAVESWAQADGRPGVLQLLANCVPTEFANMYDIIENDWDKSGQATPTQTANWNAIVAKYNLY